MPRGRRGGNRVGTPGAAYPNRTDLSSGRPLAVQTAPNQTYGAAQQQQNAMRTVPMASAPVPGAGQGPPAASGPGAAVPPPPGGGGLAGAPIQPGQVGSLFRPTDRPNEPVTAGAASGPGPGPEAILGPGATTGGAMSAMLAHAASTTASPALRALAQQAAAMGR